MLSQVVSIHYHFMKMQVEPVVLARNPLYRRWDDEDVIGSFFERRKHEPNISHPTIPYLNDLYVSLSPLGSGLTIKVANEVFFSRYKIRPEFEDRIAVLSDTLPKSVGVHFRGSDKNLEAARVNWRYLTDSTDKVLDGGVLEHVFVASDEADFVSHMTSRYGRRVITLEAKHLACGSTPAHFGSGDGREKGAEALDVILALARCGVCVRGASHLSAWAKILNPNLPVIVFGSPFSTRDTFPEDAIRAMALETHA
ncbi:MAG: hypothetical protein EON59_03095 [Alphaproteobacteria bacterium]|nr:MAG: hypothetical protein EON59_03095 [Alphaproteobacteria bacterium]